MTESLQIVSFHIEDHFYGMDIRIVKEINHEPYSLRKENERLKKEIQKLKDEIAALKKRV